MKRDQAPLGVRSLGFDASSVLKRLTDVRILRHGHAARRLALAIALLPVLVVALSGTPAIAADYDVRIKGQSQDGTIPPKTSRGNKDTVAIVGEGTGETEFLAADEMSNAVASAMEKGPHGEVALRVLAVPGKGGVHNVRDVLGRPNMDFGIVPIPVLEAAAASEGMGNLKQRIAYVAPLYFEDVHVLTGNKIHEMADLEGKEVAMGEEGSSTEIIARTVLASLEVKVKPSPLTGQAAVEAVREGKVAAAFVVSGKPVDSIRQIWGRDLRLMTLPADKVPEGFVPSVITHEDYPDLVPLGLKIRTYAVQNVLFAYNWSLRSTRGKVGRGFLSVLLYRLSDLQVGDKHPKWREMNVAGVIPGWRRLPAMQAWLDKSSPRVDGPAAQAEFEGFLKRTDTMVSGDRREALYKDFLRWRSSPVSGDE